MVSLKQSSKKIKMIWTIHDKCHVLTSFSFLICFLEINPETLFLLNIHFCQSIFCCLLWKYLVQVWCKFQLASSQQAWYISGPLENMGTVGFYRTMRTNLPKLLDLLIFCIYSVKGVFSKPSGDYIVVPNFCFLS